MERESNTDFELNYHRTKQTVQLSTIHGRAFTTVKLRTSLRNQMSSRCSITTTTTATTTRLGRTTLQLPLPRMILRRRELKLAFGTLMVWLKYDISVSVLNSDM